ncbi:MAG: efflux RND transporter periplasmic adaptor subunit [bacterium]
MKNFIQKNKWYLMSIILIIIIFSFLFFGKKKNIEVELITVQKHNIIEEVNATGNVKPLSDLDLSFEISGQVSNVFVSVGDKVFQGKYLAELSNADAIATIKQAKAGLKIAQANLSSLQNGATAEQIAVNESQVEKAKSDLLNTKINLTNSIRDSYTKSDDAIRNYTDLIFISPRSQNPILQFQTDFTLQNNITTGRAFIENLLISWNVSNVNLNTNSDFDSIFKITKNNLNFIQTFLQDLAFAVNKLSPSFSIDQNTLTLWKANISIARTNIDIAINNISATENQYQSNLSSLNISNSQLALIKTGATIDQIKAQEAIVEQAKANIDSAQAKFDKTIIISPVNGIITNVYAKVGQMAQTGITAFSIISYGQYKIESYVPEADIAKIKIGNIATTTLDAYGSNTFFKTSIIKIDPSETIIENVPTYKITFAFASSSDNRIKSGMTANLDILTNQKNNILAIPFRSVYSIDNQKYVKLIDSKNSQKIIETKVETGIRGADGYIEIISGLKENDYIIASPSFINKI